MRMLHSDIFDKINSIENLARQVSFSVPSIMKPDVMSRRESYVRESTTSPVALGWGVKDELSGSHSSPSLPLSRPLLADQEATTKSLQESSVVDLTSKSPLQSPQGTWGQLTCEALLTPS
jgi:hypothetical protein